MKHYILSVMILITSIFLMGIAPEEKHIKLKNTFSQFPATHNGWSSINMPFSKDVLEVLKVDDYLNRKYSNEDGDVSFYIGFYGSQKKGATYHSPKNCLPGSGWQIMDMKSYDLKLKDSSILTINRLLIQKGLSKQLMFYWYQDRGRIISSEYSAKLYLLYDSITKHRSDGSMVRVIVNFSESEIDAEKLSINFIQDFFPLLNDYFPDS